MNIILKSLTAVLVCSSLFFAGCNKIIKPHKGTIVLTPHYNPSEVHIFGGPNIDQTFPDAVEIMGGAGTYDGEPVTIRAALKFNLDTIPENVEIKSAKLTLFSNPSPLNGQNGQANSGPDNTLLLQRITSAWVPSEVKWLNQPPVTTENEIVIPHTNVALQDVKNIDITKLIKNAKSNHGILIRLKNENPYNFRIFCSSKNKDFSKHPKLVIEYRVK